MLLRPCFRRLSERCVAWLKVPRCCPFGPRAATALSKGSDRLRRSWSWFFLPGAGFWGSQCWPGHYTVRLSQSLTSASQGVYARETPSSSPCSLGIFCSASQPSLVRTSSQTINVSSKAEREVSADLSAFAQLDSTLPLSFLHSSGAQAREQCCPPWAGSLLSQRRAHRPTQGGSSLIKTLPSWQLNFLIVNDK